MINHYDSITEFLKASTFSFEAGFENHEPGPWQPTWPRRDLSGTPRVFRIGQRVAARLRWTQVLGLARDRNLDVIYVLSIQIGDYEPLWNPGGYSPFSQCSII